VWRSLPTGRAEELARRVVDAIARGRPRVVYPSVYEVGWRAANVAARVALAFGPDPVA
jgi:hypothetical protein